MIHNLTSHNSCQYYLEKERGRKHGAQFVHVEDRKYELLSKNNDKLKSIKILVKKCYTRFSKKILYKKVTES